YNHILKVVREECFCELYLTEETKWINIPENIKSNIIKVQTNDNHLQMNNIRIVTLIQLCV
ncbi:hypothetical protein, partial [Flagellimonas sp. S3867]|uniref:hypothetical protein n=1 Tax=Flagellimonas sp. S3867 TaxID=2768063 RepID=UPI001CC23C66